MPHEVMADNRPPPRMVIVQSKSVDCRTAFSGRTYDRTALRTRCSRYTPIFHISKFRRSSNKKLLLMPVWGGKSCSNVSYPRSEVKTGSTGAEVRDGVRDSGSKRSIDGSRPRLAVRNECVNESLPTNDSTNFGTLNFCFLGCSRSLTESLDRFR